MEHQKLWIRWRRISRHQMAAGSSACTPTSPPLMKHGAVATVVVEARERTLRQRARPPCRDGGRGWVSRRLASPAPVSVSPHSLASASLIWCRRLSSGVWRQNEREVEGEE
jgi:hypothetical protein